MLTFDSASSLLKRRETKKLANNTYLRKQDDNFIVRFHTTDIITIRQDGTYILNSGGHSTIPTKSRLNKFSSVKIHQKNFIWYINDVPFYDGIIVDKSGKPVLSEKIINDNQQEKMKKLNNMIKTFITGYIDWALKNGVARSNGDCWHCLFNVDRDDLSHVYSHIEENYYFGAFLDFAITILYKQHIFHRVIVESELHRGETVHIKHILTSYFRRIKKYLIEYVTLD